MNFQFYLEKLYESPVFENFKKEFSDAVLCGGFFVIDKDGNDNKQHLDFFIPSSKKSFSFKMEDNIQGEFIENFGEKQPQEVSDKYDFDFEQIEEIILGAMKQNDIENRIQKILLSFQHLDDRDYLIGTVFISGMSLVKIQIDLTDMKFVDFEKKSFFDMIKKVK